LVQQLIFWLPIKRTVRAGLRLIIAKGRCANEGEQPRLQFLQLKFVTKYSNLGWVYVVDMGHPQYCRVIVQLRTMVKGIVLNEAERLPHRSSEPLHIEFLYDDRH
jgi:hypothetical protein